MSWYTKMNARITDDDFINDATDDFELYLADSPNKKTVYKNGIDDEGDEIYVVIQEDSTATEKTDEIKLMLSAVDDVFVVGDIITWDSIDWIVIWKDYKSIENNNKVKIMRCNNLIKYYDELYNLYTKSCVLLSGRTGEDEGKYMTLASDEHILYCANETDTSHIGLNTRFILMGDAYKVIGIDKLSKVGLLEIKVKMDQITVNDNIDLGIANYGLNQPAKSIVIKNSSTASLLYQNATLQLVVECRNNGVIVNNPTVTYSSNAVGVATVNTSGRITAIGTGTAIITANYSGVIASITINSVMEVINDYNVVVSPIDTTIIFGKSKTFTTTILNNGVIQVSQSCVWTIINSDGTNIPYATLNTNGLNCTITATNKSTLVGKYIKLRSTFVEDSNVYTEREIKIVGLL